MQVKRADNPKLFKILRQAGYRKHTVSVYVRASEECRQPYWSGGSREDHYTLDLINGNTHPIRVPGNPWPQPPATIDVETSPGFAVVHGGIFMGKPAHWAIIMHIADAQEFFPGT
jgi:hypothetical protein